MSTEHSHTVAAVLRLAQPTTLDWLVEAFGFTTSEVTPDEDGGLAHAQLWWGDDCIMVSSRPGETDHVGAGWLYLTVPADQDVDAAHARAVAAGATVLRPPVDQPYGGRGSTVIDPDGNQWSLGSYLPRKP
jgi:uncharacterized glyoxalase superfamily protein PhnB